MRNHLWRLFVIRAGCTLQKNLQSGVAAPDSEEKIMGFVLKRRQARGFAGSRRSVDGRRGNKSTMLLAVADEGRISPVVQRDVARLQREGAGVRAEIKPSVRRCAEKVPDRL